MLLISCIILSSCTVGPDFKAPDPKTPESLLRDSNITSGEMRDHNSPPDVPSKTVEGKPVEVKWWETLNDPVLNKLVERITKENLDLQTATSRVQQSRAQLGITEADFYPQVNANGSYQRIKESDKGAISLIGGGASGGTTGGGGGGAMASTDIPTTTKIPPFGLYQYGFDATWEIDLWGRVRRSVEASDASMQASEEARRDATLSAIAELVRDYVQLRGMQASIKITHENVDTASEFAHLNDERAKNGLGNELDVANANAQELTTSSQLPELEQNEAELMNAIALLLAQPPGALEKELSTPNPIPPTPPEVPIGLPTELLKRRPDIRQAEDQLHSATAEIGVAKADFFPRVTLMGNGELQSLHFHSLNDWAAHSYTFGPSIELPLFEGGRLTSTLKLRKDEQKEAALNYRKTVLTAFHEVDNALTAFRKEQERHNALQGAVGHNKDALKFANERYDNGLSTYLDVLTAQQNLQATELQEISSQQTATINVVQLYKALGGGWEANFPVSKIQAK